MNNKIYLPILIITAGLTLYYNMQASELTISKQQQSHIEETPSVVTINSLAALNALFDKLDYHEGTWKTEHKVVPRISFKGIGDNWSTKSNELPVNTKKSIFFRLITPLVLIINEQVIAERHIVKTAPLSSEKLLEIALKYRVLDVKNKAKLLTQAQRVSLLERVDILPPSLAVAQAAEESGWGTSRFASKGNALFGQWDFSGNGMKPKQQRKELGNYGVARFDSPLASVEAYVFNINTNAAYLKLRVFRAKLRANNDLVTGSELAGTLDKYSERGEAYTEGLREMIRFNKLETLDGLTLSKEKLIHLNTND